MIDPQQIADAADEVLRGPAYQDVTVSPLRLLLQELQGRFAEWLFDVFGSTSTAWIGPAIAALVVAIVVVLLVVALLSIRRSATAEVIVTHEHGATVADLQARADDARAAGDLVAAVRLRYGALLLLLAERAVLPARPGTTVGEVDAAVAERLPGVRAPVRRAGAALADVVYGHREATDVEDDAVLAAITVVEAAPRPRVVVVPA